MRHLLCNNVLLSPEIVMICDGTGAGVSCTSDLESQNPQIFAKVCFVDCELRMNMHKMLSTRKLVDVTTKLLHRTMGTAVATTTEEYWMPFTNNRAFKKNPKIISRADGVFYYTDDGKEKYDGISGLWSVNAGHNTTERYVRVASAFS